MRVRRCVCTCEKDTHAYTHMHTHTHTHAHLNIHTRTFILTLLHTRTYTHVHSPKYIDTHTDTHTPCCMLTRLCMCVCVFLSVCMRERHTLTHTRTHTHIQTCANYVTFIFWKQTYICYIQSHKKNILQKSRLYYIFVCNLFKYLIFITFIFGNKRTFVSYILSKKTSSKNDSYGVFWQVIYFGLYNM